MRLRYTLVLALLLALFIGIPACSTPAPPPAATPAATAPATPPADRKYLLERVDDAAVVQLYADGFSSLPLKQKTLIWHLYQAALAGRDIFIDQKHSDALEMRAHPRADRRAPAGRRCRDARRGAALHQAVLDQQRSLQQPHRPQVRADVHARGVCRAQGGRETAPLAAPTGETLDAMLARCSRCSSTPPSIRSSPTRRPAPARTSCRRAPTISTRA